jgi:ABC-2 type transport system permease protein
VSAVKALGTKLRTVSLNPVLAKEVRERVRSPRAVVILAIYLLLMGGVLYLTYRMGQFMLAQRGFFPSSPLAVPSLGRMMFESLVLLLLTLVAFIAPGISAGSIASERERRTLSLLQVTLLKPRSIVVGKVSASLGFVLLLIFATVPLFAIPLVLGGMSAAAVFRGFVMVLVICLFISSLAIYASSVHRRTQFAVVSAYALVFAYFVGTLLAMGAEAAMRA